MGIFEEIPRKAHRKGFEPCSWQKRQPIRNVSHKDKLDYSCCSAVAQLVRSSVRLVIGWSRVRSQPITWQATIITTRPRTLVITGLTVRLLIDNRLGHIGRGLYPLFFRAIKSLSITYKWMLAVRKSWGDERIELTTSCTRSRNHTTRPITHRYPKSCYLYHRTNGHLGRSDLFEVTTTCPFAPLYTFGMFKS